MNARDERATRSAFGDAPTDMGGAPQEVGRRSPTWPGETRELGDRYQLEEPIASGGAAIVWRAFDRVLSRSVAIKLLHPHLATDPVTVERFRLESINAARLAHPNVVAIYDTGHEDDLVYLVMEYVDGPSLREVLREHGAIDPDIIAALGEQVASALGEAHTNGVIHRDIKPANILLTSDGVAKVTDFGIAKALGAAQQDLTTPGTVVGTAAYVAPEQLENKEVDARVDVYALGVVLYECLTGRPAFSGDTPTATAAARLTHDLLPPRQVRADVPRELDEIVVRATRREPDQRYADGTAMAAAMAPMVHARPSDVTKALVSGELPVMSDDHDTDRFTAPRRAPVTSAQYGRRLVAAFLAGLALALLAFYGIQSLRDDAIAPNPVDGTVWQISTVDDFDPTGRPPEENPADVGRIADGDLTTAWTTDSYRGSADFGGTKDGVGLVVDLGSPRQVNAVLLELTRPGISLELYAADEPPEPVDGLVGWGPVLATYHDLSESATLVVPQQPQARWWLVWVTDLADAGDGLFQAGIAEARFVGP